MYFACWLSLTLNNFEISFQFELQRIKSDIQRVQKLINIAKPIELPPLKFEQTAADATQPKKSLPLFGKKKSFGFEKLKLQVANKPPSSSNQCETSASEVIEEFDDDDVDAVAKVIAKVSKSKTSNTETVPEAETAASAKSVVDDDKLGASKCSKQDFPPKSSTKEIPPSPQKTDEKIDKNKESASDEQCSSNSESAGNAHSVKNSSSSAVAPDKKGKSRHRNKIRHHIDIDDSGEDTSPQKFSSWMPPDNQTGDGMTQLNSKYGY